MGSRTRPLQDWTTGHAFLVTKQANAALLPRQHPSASTGYTWRRQLIVALAFACSVLGTYVGLRALVHVCVADYSSSPHQVETVTLNDRTRALPASAPASLGSRPASAAVANRDCPFRYTRITMEQVEMGWRPYIFGGKPDGCQHCTASDPIVDACTFIKEGGGACAWRVWGLMKRYVAQGSRSLLEFTPCDFWRSIAGRTLWISGDSQSQDLLRAVTCFLYEMIDLGWYSVDTSTGEVLPERNPGFASGAAMLQPGCVLMPNARICWIRCDNGTCMTNTVLPLLQRIGSPDDVAVVNFGLHYSENYEGSLRNLTDKYLSLRRAGAFPLMLWKETPPQHFNTTLGEYPAEGGKLPFTCVEVGYYHTPLGPKWELLPDNSLRILDAGFEVVARGGLRNKVANPVMEAAGVNIVRTWNQTLPLWDHHRDNGGGLECTHYCTPSAPQLWVHALWTTLKLSTSQGQLTPRATLLPVGSHRGRGADQHR